MAQHYSDPKRANDPNALPDIETFEVSKRTPEDECPCSGYRESQGGEGDEHGDHCYGWYWQSCTPECQPDSDPCGPFDSEEEALEDAREGTDDDDCEDCYDCEAFPCACEWIEL